MDLEAVRTGHTKVSESLGQSGGLHEAVSSVAGWPPLGSFQIRESIHVDTAGLALGETSRLACMRQLALAGRICAGDFDHCCTVGRPTVCHRLKIRCEVGGLELDPTGLELTVS